MTNPELRILCPKSCFLRLSSACGKYETCIGGKISCSNAKKTTNGAELGRWNIYNQSRAQFSMSEGHEKPQL
jgi:hypothetical protein